MKRTNYFFLYLVIGIILLGHLQGLISNIFPSNLSLLRMDNNSVVQVNNENFDSTICINSRDSIRILEKIAKDYATRLRYSDTKSFKGDYYTIIYKDEKGVDNRFDVGYTKSGCTMFFDMNLLGSKFKKSGFKYHKTFRNDSLGNYLSELFRT